MSTDERVLALQDKVKAKKAEIEKAERPSWKTNCSFSTSKSKINIQTVSKVEDLIDLTVILLHESTLHAAACKALGVEIKYLKDGFTVDDWMSDFKTRVSKIEILKKKKELAVMEARLSKMLSPEAQLEIELKELVNKFSHLEGTI
jgi:hypothetical protein